MQGQEMSCRPGMGAPRTSFPMYDMPPAPCKPVMTGPGHVARYSEPLLTCCRNTRQICAGYCVIFIFWRAQASMSSGVMGRANR